MKVEKRSALRKSDFLKCEYFEEAKTPTVAAVGDFAGRGLEITFGFRNDCGRTSVRKALSRSIRRLLGCQAFESERWQCAKATLISKNSGIGTHDCHQCGGSVSRTGSICTKTWIVEGPNTD